MEQAARLWGAAEAIREEFDMPLPPSHSLCYARDTAKAKSQLDGSAFATAWEKGRGMKVEKAIAYALGKRSVEGM